MKIAVMSDIHGNMEALEAVLEDIENNEITKLFICGDIAMAGPEPARTTDFCRTLQDKFEVAVIQGNTDEMIAKYSGQPNDKYLPPNEIMAEALKYAQNVLSNEQKSFLANLPVEYTEKVGGISIKLVHGSPRKNNEDILPNASPDKVAEMIKDTSEDLIFCGHTHLPAVFICGSQTVINVGSVGRPFTEEPKASYVILDVENANFSITHRQIKYDITTASEKLAVQDFNGADKLAGMLVQATSRYPS